MVELVPGERMVAIKHLSLAEEHLHDHFARDHEVAPDAGGGWWVPGGGAGSGGGDVVGDGTSATRIACGGSLPVMPGSLVIEGMAQTAGILVGHAGGFREKVVLAKISRAEILLDAMPGQTLRYTAVADRLDRAAASVKGTVELLSMGSDGSVRVEPAGAIDLIFSHLDQNMGGHVFPEHNFVFGETFRTLLELSGVVAGDGFGGS
ncbi:MAG: hypothetical protein ACTS3F_11195 [Phycisphaerales bacterium]